MRLRTFESFWLLKNGLLYTYPSVQKNIKTEILVIGGGITGALISHALIENGFEVTLIDKRDIGQGSTSATTSMLQYEIDEKLVDLSKKIGSVGAEMCYKAGINAIHKLEKLIKQNNIECGFMKKKSLYVAHNNGSVKKLKEEFKARNELNLGVEWLSATEIKKRYKLVSFGGILSNVAASIDAYKLTHELIAYNVKRGMNVYDQTTIESINVDNKFPLIKTDTGNAIRCKKVIFCNGFESTKLIKEKIADLIYTYAIVSEQSITIPKGLNDLLIWNTANPYLYLRTTDDGRLLVGGEDDVFKDTILQQEIKEKKSKVLQKKIKKLIPTINFIEDISWGGVFGTTKDGLPYIGESPEYKNCLWCLGFGGNGITFSIQGMDIIVDMLNNKSNSLSKYYCFGR